MTRLTISQVAKLLSITPQAVRKRIKNAGIVPKRDGVSGWQTISNAEYVKLINGARAAR